MNLESKFDSQRWMRWWHWMYKSNPSGKGRIWLAEDDGRIVGHSVIIPVAIKMGTEVVTGFQTLNALTHPEYRRQGIYVALASKAQAEAAKEGMCIGNAFPNDISQLVRIKKLGWFDVAPDATHI